MKAIYDRFQSCWVFPCSVRAPPKQEFKGVLLIQNRRVRGHTGNLLGSVPRNRSGDLVFLAEGAVLETLSIALSLSLLVLGVTLGTTFLAGGLPALETGHLTDRLLDPTHGALHSASSLAVQVVRAWTSNKTTRRM